MANSSSLVTALYIVLLVSLTITGLVSSARVLDQLDPLAPIPDPSDLPALPPTPGPTDMSATGPTPEVTAPVDDQPQPDLAGPAIAPAGPIPTGPASPDHAGPAISFFMHDVLGGSQASGRIVTGIVATSEVNGIPFSKPNSQVFPVTNGVPLLNNNNLINNNNVPYLASLTGSRSQSQSQTLIQNTGTNTAVNGGQNNQAFVTPGQLPTGAALEKLMFGSVTVIDDELTEGHELGAGVMGRGQGFYLASSLDGQSHTMAFTAILHGGEHEEVDTISFFGVHRTASPVSQIAVVGGTGKYENAKGYATIETLPQVDQHTTDGVDTIAHINVYI